MELTQERVQELKARYGELYELTADLDEGPLVVIVRKPGRAQFARFAKDMTGDAYKASTNLFFDCLVQPEPEVLRARFEASPGLVLPFSAQLMKLAKLDVEVLEKKL
jgi:hypothetical protein